MKILVLGASGMIGSAIFRVLSHEGSLEVWGSVRSANWKRFFGKDEQERLVVCNNVLA